jgi:hypothetical protein
VRETIDHFVASAASVATLYACHEDLLLLLGGEKGGATLWTKLQKLVSSTAKAVPRIYPLSHEAPALGEYS